MATSAVAICNLALSRTGNGQAIAALTEASAAAVQLNAIYEATRDYVLRDFPWGFAKRTVALALVANEPTTDWLYSHRVPADCLRVRRLINPSGRTSVSTVPFEIASDDQGELIYSDQSAPYIEYTARITSEGLFTADFVSVFAWRLVQDSAIALSVEPKFADRAVSMYDREVSAARKNTRGERQDDAPPESEFITARQ
jgi:hypothetical protein